MEEKIINAGVHNLKQFGYPAVNSENIFTDEVYSLFFKNMLNDNLGVSFEIDQVIQKILSKIK